jgi:DNA polymerase-3 subunit gamma/tau
MLDIGNKCDLNYKISNNKRLHLEIALMQMCELADRRTGGQADGRTGGQADRQTVGQADVTAARPLQTSSHTV